MVQDQGPIQSRILSLNLLGLVIRGRVHALVPTQSPMQLLGPPQLQERWERLPALGLGALVQPLSGVGQLKVLLRVREVTAPLPQSFLHNYDQIVRGAFCAHHLLFVQ